MMTNEKNMTNRLYKIAILMPSGQGAYKKVQTKFIEWMHEHSTSEISFEIFEGTSEKLATTIVCDGFDLIYTIGILSTTRVQHASLLHGRRVPIVCVGTPLKSFETQLRFDITGVAATTESSVAHKLPLLFTVKKDMKNILFLCNSDVSITLRDRVLSVMQPLCDKQNISLKVLDESSDIETIESTITQKGAEVDTIIINRTEACLGKIEKLCELGIRNGITLVGLELYSSERGIAISLGANEDVTGYEAAQKALMILEQGYQAYDIPFTTPEYNYKLRINSKVMKQQGLLISDDVFTYLSKIEIA